MQFRLCAQGERDEGGHLDPVCLGYTLYTIQAPCELHTINAVKRVRNVVCTNECIRGNRGLGGHTNRGGHDVRI
jgi:hypothetical protein